LTLKIDATVIGLRTALLVTGFASLSIFPTLFTSSLNGPRVRPPFQ